MLEGRVESGMLVLVPAKRRKKASPFTAEEQKRLARAKRKIERIRQAPTSARGLTPEEAELATRAGLIPADHCWWWTEPWQRGERQAAREISAGRTKAFKSADELVEDLRGP